MEINETNLYFSLDTTKHTIYCTSIWGAFLPNGVPPSTQTVVGNWGHVLRPANWTLLTHYYIYFAAEAGPGVTTALLSVLGDGRGGHDVQRRIYIYIYVFFVTFQALRCVLHFGGTSRRFHQNPPTNPLVRLDDERLNLSQGGFSTESSEHKTHHKKWQKKPQKQSWTTNKTPKTPKKTIQFLEKTTNIPPVNVVLFQTSSLLFCVTGLWLTTFGFSDLDGSSRILWSFSPWVGLDYP